MLCVGRPDLGRGSRGMSDPLAVSYWHDGRLCWLKDTTIESLASMLRSDDLDTELRLSYVHSVLF